MTYSHYSKVFKQLQYKPLIWEKYQKHNAPKKRTCGISAKKCRRCGRVGSHIGKYGIHLCRQCYRQVACKIGFKKYN